MTTYGVTDTGFVLKRLSQILSDMVSVLSTVQDPISGETLTPNLTDENDPLVQVVNAHSAALSEAWEQLQLAYNQFDPLKATGAGLSGLVQLNNLFRRSGTYSTVTVTIIGVEGTVISEGKQITTMENGFTFSLPEVTIPAGGTVTATATATEYGPVNIGAGELVKIVTPVSGWTSVTNSLAATDGVLEETDTALRTRQQQATSATASSVIDSVYAAIMDVTGVTFASVYQNQTLITDSRGLPGKTIAIVAVGGDDDDITDAIFNHLPLGCDTYGTTEVIKTDSQGILYPIRFWRVTEIDVYVQISVTITDGNPLTDVRKDSIKTALYNYVSQGAEVLGMTEGFDRNGYVPGETVYTSELYTPVNYMKGIKINSILIDITDPPALDYMSIAWNEQAIFSTTRIEVIVV